jgi:copper(I)-binding protein
MRIEPRRITAVAILTALTGCAEPATLTVENARVRALIPGQDKTVAYMSVRNPTSRPATLTAARSDQVRTIEIHSTRMEGGVMRMRRLESVDVPPGEAVHFQPGGHHLMLFGVTSVPTELTIQLEFADGALLEVPFEQVDMGAQ